VPPSVAIPAFETSGVLPPFHGSATNPSTQSPYRVSLVDVVQRFAGTQDRKTILSGFLRYRQALHTASVIHGMQWLDGSFLEQIELLESRSPRDIDVVTFCTPPPLLTQANLSLFDPVHTKSTYLCDAYTVNVSLGPERTIRSSAYWFGLFSHRRDRRWKGLLEIDLAPTEDAAALAALNLIGTAP
jgi:hypothetical protein